MTAPEEPAHYAWTLSARAERDAYILPRSAADACLTHVAERVVHNPHRLGKKLHGKWEGHLSCHVGAYRVIYRVDEAHRLVRVAHLGHRGKVYG